MPKSKTSRKSTRRQTKDRVLQARIPEHLDEELRDRAEQLGMSVSTIVRNVLLNTFDLVEGVVADSSEIARVFTNRGATTGATTTAPEAESTVVGWQEAILNRNGVCAACNTILPKGERAAVGVPTGPRAELLCLECLAELSSDAAAANPSIPAGTPNDDEEGNDENR